LIDGPDGKKTFTVLVVRGRIVYRDAFRGEYFTGFGFVAHSPTLGKITDLTPIANEFPMYVRAKPQKRET
jgi:hypothetical protein